MTRIKKNVFTSMVAAAADPSSDARSEAAAHPSSSSDAQFSAPARLLCGRRRPRVERRQRTAAAHPSPTRRTAAAARDRPDEQRARRRAAVRAPAARLRRHFRSRGGRGDDRRRVSALAGDSARRRYSRRDCGRRAESVLVSTDGACAQPDVAAGRQKHSVRDVLIPPWLPSTRRARILDMRSMSVSMPIRNF